MRILHVIPAVADRYGGPSTTVLSMSRELAARGVDVTIATTDADGRGRLDVPLARVIEYRGAPVIFFRRRWGESLKYSAALARWLDERVTDYDVTHIHAVFSHACVAAARACRARGRPYVVRPLGTLDPSSLQQHAWRKRLFWKLGAERMLRSAAAVHYTTDAERRRAEVALDLDAGVVIPLAVSEALVSDRSVAHPRPDAAGAAGIHYVLFLGRLHPQKRPDLLLEAFARAMGPDPSAIRLILAGSGDRDYVDSLRSRARALGLGSAVRFTGWISGAEKSALLAHAALFALLSERESFGLAVVEAMSFGVPVLISDRVNLADQVEKADAGWVVPLDADAVTDVLAGILADPAARNRRRQTGPALVDKMFRWSSVADQLTALYERIRGSRISCPLPTESFPER